MKIDITQNEILKRYLLDELDESEQIEVEEAFFTDYDTFDDLIAVEDELFYEYSGNELTPSQKTVFEAKFLRTREDRDRVAFSSALLETTAEYASKQAVAVETAESKGFLASISTFFKMGSAMQAGMAAGLILIAIGVAAVFINRSRVDNNIADNAKQAEELQRQQAEDLANAQRQRNEIDDQLAAENAKAAANDARVKELEAEKDKISKEIEAKRRAAEQKTQISQPGGQRTIATLVLSPGLFTREDGKPMNRIKLDPTAASLNLTLQLKNVGDYSKYGVNVVSVDSGVSLKAVSGLVPSGKGSIRNLKIAVPAKAISRGDYEIELLGITKSGESERVTRYYFSVDR